MKHFIDIFLRRLKSRVFEYSAWILFLIITQLLFSLWGILSKYLQAKPNAPIPPLRLVLLISLLSEGILILVQVFRLVIQQWLWSPESLPLPSQQACLSATESGQTASKSCSMGDAEDIQQQVGKVAEHQADTIQQRISSQQVINQAGARLEHKPEVSPSCTLNTERNQQKARGQYVMQIAKESFESSECSNTTLERAIDPEQGETHALNEPRGLSQKFSMLREYNPKLAKYVALVTIVITFTITCGLQICAPGFVDPSIVQLVNQFTAVGTALVQATILRHRLPWYIWPSIALMIGGAIMIIVPTLGNEGIDGLGTQRGRLGFGMAIIALVATVAYFITIQATHKMGFTSTQLLHCFLWFSIVVFTVLSLPIEGTNWTQQLQGWGAGNWLILVAICPVYIGSIAAIQHCIWRLGAPMVAIFLGLRLIFSAVLTNPVLGFTVISTGVQIAGVVLTAGAVTGYAGLRWWDMQIKASKAQGS